MISKQTAAKPPPPPPRALWGLGGWACVRPFLSFPEAVPFRRSTQHSKTHARVWIERRAFPPARMQSRAELSMRHDRVCNCIGVHGRPRKKLRMSRLRCLLDRRTWLRRGFSVCNLRMLRVARACICFSRFRAVSSHTDHVALTHSLDEACVSDALVWRFDLSPRRHGLVFIAESGSRKLVQQGYRTLKPCG